MSRAIRSSSTFKQNRDAAVALQSEDAQTFVVMSRHLVRDRFPLAQERIVQRLAVSMAIRRNRLLYRERRFKGQAIQLTHLSEESKTAPRSEGHVRLSTPLVKLPTQQPTMNKRMDIDSIHSGTRTGTTVNQELYLKYSAPSTIVESTYKSANIGSFQYPPIPKASKDGKLVCPYCWLHLTDTEIRTEASWM